MRWPRFQDLSIRLKLTWVSVLSSGLALLLAATAFVTYELITFRDAMVRELSTQAEIVGFNSAAAIVFGDQKSAAQTLAALRSVPQVLAAGIRTDKGELFATYQRADQPIAAPLPAVDLTDGHHFDNRQLSVIRPVVLDGERIGTVYIQSDLSEWNARVKGYTAIVVGVLLACILATFIISYRLQRVISGPILHLVDTAHLVSSEKNYGVRAAPGGRDELGM